MNKEHNPWHSTSTESNGRPGWSFCEFGTCLPEAIRRFMACASQHIRKAAFWWSSRLRLFWRAGDVGSRLAAVGLFVAGLAGILILAHLILYLIPFILLAAFIAAICVAIGAGMSACRR